VGAKNWKTEGGSGGKRGHSNMDQWLYHDEMKNYSRTARRLQAKSEIKDQLAQEQRWSLWRQDDNGQRYEIERNLPLKQARDRLSEFESHAHKQTYWIEPTA